MCGYYVAVNDAQLELIEDGEFSLYEFGDFEKPSEMLLDIDKSWQVLYYILCGDIADGAAPMGYVVPMADDCYMGMEEMEFGSFLLSPQKVKEAYDYMQTLDKAKLKNMYNIDELVEEEVYPLSVADKADKGEEFFEYVYHYFEEIKEFYKKALEKQLSVIFYIS